MSILVSNTNSSTVYVLTKDDANISGTTRDPRYFGESLLIYFSRGKNNLTCPDSIKEHKAVSEQFMSDHGSYCCLNCYAFLPEESTKCASCYQPYCGVCSSSLQVKDKCPACKKISWLE